MMNELFYFISDEKFRGIIESDYNEMHICFKNGAYKGCIVLAGSIIEALLIDYVSFLSIPDKEKEELLKLTLKPIIDKCNKLGILSEREKNLSDVVRDYRNLIHPGKSFRIGEYPSKEEASISLSLVNMIVKDISKKKQETYGYTADQIIRKIENDATSRSIWPYFIKRINNHEKESLLIEKLPSKYLDEYYREFLRQDVTIYREFFIQLYKSSNIELQRKAAFNFIKVLKEDNEGSVLQYVNNFFTLEFLSFYEKEDSEMVKQHLIGLASNNISISFLHAIYNFTNYLDDNELLNFVNSLLDHFILKNTLETDKNLEPELNYYFYKEYTLLNNDRKRIIHEQIGSLKHIYSTYSSYIKKLNELEDYLINPIEEM